MQLRECWGAQVWNLDFNSAVGMGIEQPFMLDKETLSVDMWGHFCPPAEPEACLVFLRHVGQQKRRIR